MKAESEASSFTMADDLKGTNPNQKAGENGTSHLEPITSKEIGIDEPQSDEKDDDAKDIEKVPSKGATAGMIDPSSFPDGGTTAWLVVFGGFCSLFCSFGWINAIGVFQEYYQNTLLSSYSPSTVAWIVSCETFFMFVLGPVMGKVFDNYGPRYLLLVGTFLHVFGVMMTSLSTQYYHFILAQGICSSIGASAVFYGAMSSVTTWFFHRRALALGIMASGSSLGGVIWPIMVQRLIPEVGFPWTMRICGFLILFMLIIMNLTVKSRLPPSPRPFSVMDFVRPLGEPAFLLVCLGSLGVFFGLFLPFNYVILQALEIGMNPDLAGYLLAILNAASIFGRIIPGFLGDKFGRYNVIIAMCYFSGILVLALWLPSKTNAGIIAFAAFYGFASGTFVSMAPSVVAQISDIRQIGVRNGTLFAIVSIGALTGNPIGGALLSENRGDFTHLQIFCGVLILFGSTMFVASRWTLVKWKLLIKV